MFEKISSLLKALEKVGFDRKSNLLIRVAAIRYPDNDKIIEELKNKFKLEDSKWDKVSKFLGIKNKTLSDSTDENLKNESEVAKKLADSFLLSNQDIKNELIEAQKLWDTWGSWIPSQKQEQSPKQEKQSDGYDYRRDADGFQPGKKISIFGVPLSYQPDFYYLNPYDQHGEIMGLDDFIEFWVKNGVIPANFSSGRSIYFEKALNTFRDIYDEDEDDIEVYLNLLRMEDSMYQQQTGYSRFFKTEKELRDEEAGEYSFDEDDRAERLYRKLKDKAYKLSFELKRSLSEKEKLLEGVAGESIESSSGLNDEEKDGNIAPEAQRASSLNKKIESSSDEIFNLFLDALEGNSEVTLSSNDVYNIILSNLDTYSKLFSNNKKSGLTFAEWLANHNPVFFMQIDLHKVYAPEEYKFSEKAIEKFIYTPQGLKLFFENELWKELPDFFLEIAAEQDPGYFFRSSAFKTGAANQKSIEIASRAFIEIYCATGDYESYLGEIPELFWLKLGIASKVPREHFDEVMQTLSRLHPALFLGLSTSDGKRISDLYPDLKEIAEEGMDADSWNRDYIEFFKPMVPGGKVTWADYYPGEQAKKMKEMLLLELSESYDFEISKDFMTEELYKRPELRGYDELAIRNIVTKIARLQRNEGEYFYIETFEQAKEWLRKLGEWLREEGKGVWKELGYSRDDVMLLIQILNYLKL